MAVCVVGVLPAEHSCVDELRAFAAHVSAPVFEDEVSIGGSAVGTMTTNLGGKLTISVELNGEPVAVEIKKA